MYQYRVNIFENDVDDPGEEDEMGEKLGVEIRI